MLNKIRQLLQQREVTIIGRTSLLKEGRREDSRCCNVKTSWHQYFDNGWSQGMHKSIWQPKDEAAADSVFLVRGWHQASSIKYNRCNLETNTIKSNLNFLLGCTSQQEFNLKQWWSLLPGHKANSGQLCFPLHHYHMPCPSSWRDKKNKTVSNKAELTQPDCQLWVIWRELRGVL